MSDRYGAFSVYAPQPQPSTYDSGYAHGGPDEGQAFDIPAGWDPYEVLRRYAQTANDAEEKTA